MKGKESKEALIIDYMENKDDIQLQQTGLAEDLAELNINPSRLERIVHVGRALSKEFKVCLKELLTVYKDAFSWTHTDMPEIDPRVITHRLTVNPSARPIRQKNRTFSIDRNQVTINEVNKLLKVKFIREIVYPD